MVSGFASRKCAQLKSGDHFIIVMRSWCPNGAKIANPLNDPQSPECGCLGAGGATSLNLN